jgi:hypothetical protein
MPRISEESVNSDGLHVVAQANMENAVSKQCLLVGPLTQAKLARRSFASRRKRVDASLVQDVARRQHVEMVASPNPCPTAPSANSPAT